MLINKAAVPIYLSLTANILVRANEWTIKFLVSSKLFSIARFCISILILFSFYSIFRTVEFYIFW